MILTQTSEYALRVMTAIALAQGAYPLKADKISEQIACPRHYVSKVLRKLVTAGLLKGSKGHGGGFFLSKPPNQILFCHIIDAVDGKPKKKHCIFGWRECNSKKPCILHNRWNKVSDTFMEWSRTTSLADIQNDAKGIQWLFDEDQGL